MAHIIWFIYYMRYVLYHRICHLHFDFQMTILSNKVLHVNINSKNVGNCEKKEMNIVFHIYI